MSTALAQSGDSVDETTRRHWRAVGRLYQHVLTGLVLRVLRDADEGVATELMFRVFRAQHERKFLPGLAALGLDDLPDAVKSAQYIYLGNHLGGVKVAYARESDRKAWVRYPPPRWIFDGATICAIPSETSRAMMRGFHAQCGVSLGNPRLGFVCTGVTVDGDPGLEGYFLEGETDLAADERLRFSPGERGPEYVAADMPRADWGEARLEKARRNYAMAYIGNIVARLSELLDEPSARAIGIAACRLIGMQLYDELARAFGPIGADADGFAALLCAVTTAEGDRATTGQARGAATVERVGWRPMGECESPGAVHFAIWNALWEGALAVHDRRLALAVEGAPAEGAWRWRIG